MTSWREKAGGCGGRGCSGCGGPRRWRRTVGAFLLVAMASLAPSRTLLAQTVPDATSAETPPGGHLLLRAADGSESVAPVLEVDVVLRVAGMVARGSVSQRFANPSDRWLEALYVFPLPEHAAVDGLRMQIGERRIEGEIREREQARRVYEAARANGQRASLLEQHRPNAFTSRVANIPPRSEIRVEIDFQQSVAYRDGEFDLRLPWIVAPRYFPPGATSGEAVADDAAMLSREAAAAAAAEGVAPDVALAIDLDPGVALDAIESPTHALRFEHLDANRLLVTLEDDTVPADRDFVLRWRPTPGRQPMASLFREERDGEHYLLLMLLPPAASEAEGPPARAPEAREIVFVIDTSGSMGGASIVQARAALRLAIERLEPRDRFNVIAFASETRTLFPKSTHADPGAVERALDFVDGLEAGGGTDMLPALLAALRDERGGDGLRQIVFVTDGCVGNEAQLLSAVRAGLGRSRLFTVGIGSAPNGHFMDGAARFGRGARVSIASPEEVGTRMEALFAKLERPALTELEIAWPDRTESWPARLPDLYFGEPLVVTARVSRFLGDVRVSGNLGGRPWEAALPFAPGRSELGIEKLFGRRKIAARMDGLITGDSEEDVKRDVLETALEHGLVSRYTSLVAVERTPARPLGEGLAEGRAAPGTPAGFVLPQGATPAPLWLAWALASGLAGVGFALRARWTAQRERP